MGAADPAHPELINVVFVFAVVALVGWLASFLSRFFTLMTAWKTSEQPGCYTIKSLDEILKTPLRTLLEESVAASEQAMPAVCQRLPFHLVENTVKLQGPDATNLTFATKSLHNSTINANVLVAVSNKELLTDIWSATEAMPKALRRHEASMADLKKGSRWKKGSTAATAGDEAATSPAEFFALEFPDRHSAAPTAPPIAADMSESDSDNSFVSCYTAATGRRMSTTPVIPNGPPPAMSNDGVAVSHSFEFDLVSHDGDNDQGEAEMASVASTGDPLSATNRPSQERQGSDAPPLGEGPRERERIGPKAEYRNDDDDEISAFAAHHSRQNSLLSTTRGNAQLQFFSHQLCEEQLVLMETLTRSVPKKCPSMLQHRSEFLIPLVVIVQCPSRVMSVNNATGSVSLVYTGRVAEAQQSPASARAIAAEGGDEHGGGLLAASQRTEGESAATMRSSGSGGSGMGQQERIELRLEMIRIGNRLFQAAKVFEHGVATHSPTSRSTRVSVTPPQPASSNQHIAQRSDSATPEMLADFVMQSQSLDVDASDDSHQCQVCFSAVRDTILLPCAHFVICCGCSRRLHVCPICRKTIESTLMIIRSGFGGAFTEDTPCLLASTTSVRERAGSTYSIPSDDSPLMSDSVLRTSIPVELPPVHSTAHPAQAQSQAPTGKHKTKRPHSPLPAAFHMDRRSSAADDDFDDRV